MTKGILKDTFSLEHDHIGYQFLHLNVLARGLFHVFLIVCYPKSHYDTEQVTSKIK